MPSKKSRFIPPSVLALVLVALSPAGAELYRWVDSEGKIHYSDRVPPEHAEHEREIRTPNGRTLGVVERAKTREELEAERRTRASREAADRAREEERQRRANHDRVLMLTYTKVSEIERARDIRIEAIESRIEATQSMIDSLEKELKDSQRRAAQAERSGREREKLTKRVNDLQRRIDTHKEFIAERRDEQEKTHAQFQADIERFKQLRNGGR